MLNYKDIYNYTESYLDELSKANGVANLDKYYAPTDNRVINNYQSMNWRQRFFASMALHGQNRQRLKNIVSFIKNQGVIADILCQYDVDAFLKIYGGTEGSCLIGKQVKYVNKDKLKGTLVRELHQNDKKMLEDYARMLICSAYFLSQFPVENKSEFDKFIKDKLQNDNLISYFAKNFPGFGTALAFDLLKETDVIEGLDLVKPDVHIKAFLDALHIGYSDDDTAVTEFIGVVERINSAGVKLTNYKFDKMIWLISSGDFYLDIIRERNPQKKKQEYLSKF